MHALRDWLTNWFSWPAGGVWSNLGASFIWTGLVWLPSLRRLHRKVEKQHAEITEQAQTIHDEATAQRQAHHDEIKRHLGIKPQPEKLPPGTWDSDLI